MGKRKVSVKSDDGDEVTAKLPKTTSSDVDQKLGKSIHKMWIPEFDESHNFPFNDWSEIEKNESHYFNLKKKFYE